MSNVSWDISVGQVFSRADRAARYGGSTRGGIQPSRTTPNVFLYSDPLRGRAFGYDLDGWSEDGSVFLYTGEGRVGDQQMTSGNRAVLMHREEGRALRLFVADGLVKGTGAKRNIYVGQFETDPRMACFTDEAPDEKQADLRKVIVFRLLPVGEALYRQEDRSPTGDVSRRTEVMSVALEKLSTAAFSTAGRRAATALRREAELCNSYVAFIERPMNRWQIIPVGQSHALYTDNYDEEAQELYEAKSSVARNAIRLGIGQLFDYRRHIEKAVGHQIKVSLLLPERPAQDLLDLVVGLGINCVYRAGEEFERIDSSS